MRYTQPQSGPVRLSQLALSLGFTQSWNFGTGETTPPNLVDGTRNLTAFSVDNTSGPGGNAATFNGSNTSRLEVAGNPFSTDTCTYLWVDSGIDSTSGGQAVTESRYGNSGINQMGSIELRIVGTVLRILSAFTVVKFEAPNVRDNTGQTNVTAVSIAGAAGRHAIFARGQLLSDGIPANTSAYQFGTSAIGGSFDTPSGSVKNYALFFAPKVIPDDALAALTLNPWQLFEDDPDSDQLMFMQSAAPTSVTAALAWTEAGETASISSLITNRAAVAWSETGDTMAVASVVTDRGTLTWTEQSETVSLIGAAQSPAASSYTANIAWVEASDTMAIGLSLLNRASIVFTEHNETWAMTGVSVLPPGSPYPQLNIYTIMRDTSINVTAPLGVSINLTGKLL